MKTKVLIGLAVLNLAFLFLTEAVCLGQKPPDTPVPPVTEPESVGIISGQVLEEGTGVPLPGETAPYITVQIHWRPTLNGAYSWVAGSNCWPVEGQVKQGCVDTNGVFTFYATSYGKELPTGYYLMDVVDIYARTFLLKRTEFYFDGYSFLMIFLTRSPVLLEISSATIPSAGPWELKYTLFNQVSVPLALMIKSFVYLPGKTSSQIIVPVTKIVTVTGDSATVTETIEIPAEIPNGLSVCVTAQVAQAGSPTDVYATTYFCGVKGVNSTETPKG